jgi:hypothetical protein
MVQVGLSLLVVFRLFLGQAFFPLFCWALLLLVLLSCCLAVFFLPFPVFPFLLYFLRSWLFLLFPSLLSLSYPLVFFPLTPSLFLFKETNQPARVCLVDHRSLSSTTGSFSLRSPLFVYISFFLICIFSFRRSWMLLKPFFILKNHDLRFATHIESKHLENLDINGTLRHSVTTDNISPLVPLSFALHSLARPVLLGIQSFFFFGLFDTVSFSFHLFLFSIQLHSSP